MLVTWLLRVVCPLAFAATVVGLTLLILAVPVPLDSREQGWALALHLALIICGLFMDLALGFVFAIATVNVWSRR